MIVSRWYGGILLGPDRFKHINNAARNVLESAGFIEHKVGTFKDTYLGHVHTRASLTHVPGRTRDRLAGVNRKITKKNPDPGRKF